MPPFLVSPCISIPTSALCVWCTASKLSWLKCRMVLQSSADEAVSGTCHCTERRSRDGKGWLVCLGSEKESLWLDWDLAKGEERVRCREGQTIQEWEYWKKKGSALPVCPRLSPESKLGPIPPVVDIGQRFSHLKSSGKLPFLFKIARCES